MKKIYLSLFMAFTLFTGAFAQEVTTETTTETSTPLVNKHGHAILPQAGDIAIGMDMVPFMNYLGNFANNTANNSYNGRFLGGANTIFLKYFLEDEAAVRIKFKSEVQTTYDDYYVRDDAAFLADPMTNNVVVDRQKEAYASYGLGLGYEMHRGYNRLRGIYGVEFEFDYTKDNYTYEYGNTMTGANTAPTTSNFGGGSGSQATRMSQMTNPFGAAGTTFGLGAFVGVEYFVLPKLSIGSELAWGFAYHKSSQANMTSETWNGAEITSENVLLSPKTPSFNLGMANPSVKLYMMFHF